VAADVGAEACRVDAERGCLGSGGLVNVLAGDDHAVFREHEIDPLTLVLVGPPDRARGEALGCLRCAVGAGQVRALSADPGEPCKP
jgi:hypothetical protein